MSTIYSFAVSLPATLARKNLEQILDTTQDSLVDTLLPMLRGSVDLVNTKTFHDPEVKKMVAQFYRMTRLRNNGFQKDLLEAAETVAQALRVVRKDLTKSLPNTIARETITYRQLGYLQFVMASELFVDYLGALLIYVMRAENAKAEGSRVEDQMNRASLAYIRDNWLRFVSVVQLLGAKDNELAKELREAADIIVEEGADVAVTHVHGTAKVNPMKYGFVATRFNLFYKIGMALAEHRNQRYKVLQEQVELYEVLLAHQKQLAQKQTDPLIEQRIEELTTLIESLQYRLEKLSA